MGWDLWLEWEHEGASKILKSIFSWLSCKIDEYVEETGKVQTNFVRSRLKELEVNILAVQMVYLLRVLKENSFLIMWFRTLPVKHWVTRYPLHKKTSK